MKKLKNYRVRGQYKSPYHLYNARKYIQKDILINIPLFLNLGLRLDDIADELLERQCDATKEHSWMIAINALLKKAIFRELIFDLAAENRNSLTWYRNRTIKFLQQSLEALEDDTKKNRSMTESHRIPLILMQQKRKEDLYPVFLKITGQQMLLEDYFSIDYDHFKEMSFLWENGIGYRDIRERIFEFGFHVINEPTINISVKSLINDMMIIHYLRYFDLEEETKKKLESIHHNNKEDKTRAVCQKNYIFIPWRDIELQKHVEYILNEDYIYEYNLRLYSRLRSEYFRRRGITSLPQFSDEYIFDIRDHVFY